MMDQSTSSILLVVLALLALGLGAGCRRTAPRRDVEASLALARDVSNHTLQDSVGAVPRSAQYQIEVFRPDNEFKSQYREPFIVRLVPRGKRDPVYEWQTDWCGTFALDGHALYVAEFACNGDFGFQEPKIRRVQLPAGDVVWTRPLPFLERNEYHLPGSSRGTEARVMIQADSFYFGDRSMIVVTARDTAGTDVYRWNLAADDGAVLKGDVLASRLYAEEDR
jgi:hypothetical protein